MSRGRYSRNPAYAPPHPADHYRLSWTCVATTKDHVCVTRPANARDTDKAGALRFAKKQGLAMPVEGTK